MNSAEKRVRNCVACQGRLPAGSRIDRKYCSQACITRAYYQRHPEKKRVLLSRTRKNADAEVRPQAKAAGIVSKSARLEADNATLRQRLDAAQQQIAELKATNLRSREQAQAQAKAAASQTEERLVAARQKIAELERQLMIETKRAECAERRQNELGTRPSAAEHPMERGSATEGSNREQIDSHPAVHGGKRIIPKSPHCNSPMPPPLSTTADNRTPHPWELPPELPGQPPVPKWVHWRPVHFEQLREVTRQAIESIPAAIRKQGQRKLSAIIEKWLINPSNTAILTELCCRIALRIICTDPLERRNQGQKETLAPLALRSAVESMAEDRPADAEEIKQKMIVDQPAFLRLSFELVNACKEYRLK